MIYVRVSSNLCRHDPAMDDDWVTKLDRRIVREARKSRVIFMAPRKRLEAGFNLHTGLLAAFQHLGKDDHVLLVLSTIRCEL